MMEMVAKDDIHKFVLAIEKTNHEAAMQTWRKTPFPERRYERLSDDVVCAGLSAVDEQIASYELRTNLPDSFVGLSYKYNDTGQSEAWMKSVVEETGSGSTSEQAAMALAADESVMRAQIKATMENLLRGVEDRVMTDANVLYQSELRSANWLEPAAPSNANNLSNASSDPKAAPEVVEQPVWGIDCYTRQNITHCLEVEFDSKTVLGFIEKWLLPAINACPEDLGHDIINAAYILEGKPVGEQSGSVTEGQLRKGMNEALLRNALIEKIKTAGPPWLQLAANQLRRAREALGPNFFRVHPKGHGSVLLSPVKPHTLVTFYRGELYPSWRWEEKEDAIHITQKRKNLKPALPDFYNMTLERPQSDPRGYGILFVDASRKAGHGSSLSHSCAPTCDVRVTALNGRLAIAMTTLRELEMGEELTFDYSAATDSFNEWHSAVCLCGYGRCRGSFLHLSTADCYQQVLKRNAPIASRFAWLVKGSMKKVMAEDDERVLRSHGFWTAVFGAISVNRRKASGSDRQSDNLNDSIDYVPIWLRTFVADTLRYIEYERRALPIALICDHLSTSDGKENLSTELYADEPVEVETESIADCTPVLSKEPKVPLRSFFYFSSTQHEFLKSLFEKQGGVSHGLTGIQLRQALLKVASEYWKELPEEQKGHWKEQAIAAFQKKRKKWLAEKAKAEKSYNKKNAIKQANGKNSKSQSDRKKTKGKSKLKPEIADVLRSSKISFQDADAEGARAMEQRIQQLTKSLSRVGRILDRHRELSFEQNPFVGLDAEAYAKSMRSRVHSPIGVASDEHVIGWMWNSENGVVKSLIGSIQNAKIARRSLAANIEAIRAKYSSLEAFGDPTTGLSPLIDSTDDSEVSPAKGRQLLKEALCKMRSLLVSEVKDMGRDLRCYRTLVRQEMEKKEKDGADSDYGEGESAEMVDGINAKRRENSDDTANQEKNGERKSEGHREHEAESTPESLKAFVSTIMDDLIKNVEERAGESVLAADAPALKDFADPIKVPMTSEAMLAENPWLDHYHEKFTLQAAADLLSFYAHTRNFFLAQPYSQLKSTPIEVYARELGNAVPRSAMDSVPMEGNDRALSSGALQRRERSYEMQNTPSSSTSRSSVERTSNARASSSSDDELCEPDDIMANVTVTYNGDYVLSQLLEWYKSGNSQESSLPDMLGCVLLPSMSACWNSILTEMNKKSPKVTYYEKEVRPRLIEWMRDPYQRGSPWPEEIQKAFVAERDQNKSEDKTLLLGSPIVDFLVSGDESSITAVLNDFDADDRVSSKKGSDGLLESVDKGRPAQAVCTWVQCENPDCLKWRKIPWHVDPDTMPEKFFCKDNKWDLDFASCDALEEDWDEDDKMVGDDGKIEGSPLKKDPNASLSPQDEQNFYIGGKCGTSLAYDSTFAINCPLISFDIFGCWTRYSSVRCAS